MHWVFQMDSYCDVMEAQGWGCPTYWFIWQSCHIWPFTFDLQNNNLHSKQEFVSLVNQNSWLWSSNDYILNWQTFIYTTHLRTHIKCTKHLRTKRWAMVDRSSGPMNPAFSSHNGWRCRRRVPRLNFAPSYHSATLLLIGNRYICRCFHYIACMYVCMYR